MACMEATASHLEDTEASTDSVRPSEVTVLTSEDLLVLLVDLVVEQEEPCLALVLDLLRLLLALLVPLVLLVPLELPLLPCLDPQVPARPPRKAPECIQRAQKAGQSSFIGKTYIGAAAAGRLMLERFGVLY